MYTLVFELAVKSDWYLVKFLVLGNSRFRFALNNDV